MSQSTGPDQRHDLWSKIWKDRHGHVVIWQMPNIPLIAWAVLTAISLFFSGSVANILSGLGSAALVIWALLEVFRGTNYFRRALGLLVLVVAVMSLVKSL